jgi:hypothetical protein
MTTPILTTPQAVESLRPDVHVFPPEDLLADALIISATTKVGVVREKRHGDVIAGERVRFDLRCYWRRRPLGGEMSPPSNRTGFRPDAAMTAHGPRFRDNQTRSRLRDRTARRAILIGTLRWAYHVVLQRNTGQPDLYLT